VQARDSSAAIRAAASACIRCGICQLATACLLVETPLFASGRAAFGHELAPFDDGAATTIAKKAAAAPGKMQQRPEFICPAFAMASVV